MQKFIERLKKVDKGTLIRSASLIVTLLNLVAMGITEICGAHSTAYVVVSIIAAAVSALIAGWQDNNWSDFAILMGKVWNAKKDGKITTEEVEDMLNKEEKHDNDD